MPCVSDIDECGSDQHVCHKTLAKCVNTPGSYKCRCKSGYTGNGTVCEGEQCSHQPLAGIDPAFLTGHFASFADVNECDSDMGLNRCSEGSTCVNRYGSYECKCQAGYEMGKNGLCKDIDECAASSNECHKHARCINKKGSYDCQCEKGYSGNGRQCKRRESCECENSSAPAPYY